MLTVNFDPFPELTTKRLHLRPVVTGDREEVFALRSDKEHMRYIAKPLISTLEEAEQHIGVIRSGVEKNEMINWAISLKGNTKLIGIIGYYRMAKEHHRSEVGYMLHKEHWRKGIMDEALKAVLEYGFRQIRFHQVEAIIDKDNVASEKLLLKNSFVKEAHFKENYFFEDRFLDSVHYSLLNNRT